ncbi:hypothetical protein SAMN05421733_10448 [Acinetobacter boissieri]|uniref:Uncharacterized protein n=1 Tax=Acinetobacter boissieri TaxID=1219383 RepID=A0A1G6H6I9_9GAMM|nr:hypothetical protein SAMN05421733_10448 [Acinetobacter boissieri]
MLKRPTRVQYGSYLCGLLFGLASGGVYLAMNCYQPCGALLPHPFTLTTLQWRSPLCCTCRRLTPPRRYLAPYPMKPGLSSPTLVTKTSIAATVQLTSAHMLTNLTLNCLYFFQQLFFHTSHVIDHAFLHALGL